MAPPPLTRRSFLAAAALAPLAAAAATAGPPPLRVAQLGTAHSHATGKMAALRSLPDLYQVAGLAEPARTESANPVRHPAYAGIPRLTEDALLADASIRVVTVETSLADATRAAHACLRAGKHVHLDKPGGASHPEFKAMRLEARRRGLTVQMGYMLRYNPGCELLFRAHREGWLGTITEIDASMGKLADAGKQAELASHPGHGMFELACHLVDVVVFLLGPPAAVHAFGRPTGLAPGPSPDNQLAVLEYPQATVTLRCNHGDPFGGPHRRLQVVGTRGAFELQPLESGRGSLRLLQARDRFRPGDNPFALDVPPGRYDGEFRDLARVVRGEKPLAWSADHDIAVHATALRCGGIDPG